MKQLFMTAAALLLAAAGRLCGMALVEDGQPAATIVTAPNPPAPVELAVAELQAHLQKMSGVALPRKTDREAVAGPVVLVGESERTRQLGLRGSDFKRREYLVQTRPAALILMGRDQQIFTPLHYDDRLSAETRLQPPFALWDNGTEYDEVGSAYAVYHFLERECGVRWYLPTDAGTFVPEHKTVTAENLNVRRAPWMHYVGSGHRIVPRQLYAWDPAKPLSGDDLASWRDSHLWHLRNKVYGAEPTSFSHAFLGWYHLFGQDHPNWFSKGHEHGKPSKRHFCYTNPELVNRIIKEARDYFDGRGNKQLRMAPRALYKRWMENAAMVSVSPLDGGGWCQCARCQAMLSPECEVKPPLCDYHSGSASRYIFSYVAQVADAIAASHPGKQIGCIAYYKYFQCPGTLTNKRENLSMAVCLVARSWKCWPAAAECEKREMEKWKQAAGRLYAYLYDQAQEFPAFVYDADEQRMRYFHQLGVRGLFLDGLSTRVAYQNPGDDASKVTHVWRNPMWDLFFWYGMVKMADDPEIAMTAWYNELYRNWFGKAAPAIKRFVAHAQKIYNDPKRGISADGIPQRSGSALWTEVCRSEDLDILGKHIAAAHRLADTSASRAKVKLFDEAVWQCILHNKKNWAEQEQKKQAPVPQISAPFVRDADPEALDWSRAAGLNRFRTMDNQPVGEKVAHQGGLVTHPLTEVQLMYAATNIYLRITCHDPDTSRLRRHQTRRDHPGICSDDGVEIFFDPGRTGKAFKQIVINANGAVYDLDQNGKEWNSGAAIRVSVATNHWTILAAIPINALEEQGGLQADGANLLEGARPGATWGFNVCRNFRGDGSPLYSAWSPTFGGWRTPERFGVLTFTAETAK